MVFAHTFGILLAVVFLHTVFASDGDRSAFYQNCLSRCVADNCTLDGKSYKESVQATRPLMNELMLWNCNDECRYSCMWRTVLVFRERGWPTPKFHGKWPFVRVLGIQELGSVVGSLFNLVAHLFMYKTLRHSFSDRNTPLLWLWRIFSLVCIHAWIWSIIFHMRDTPFTEFMDYACALSMVMILYVSCGLRLTYGKSKLIAILVLATSAIYYVDHVRYLYSGDIDYEYNMLANIVPGSLAVALWTAWGCWRCRRYPYTWRILLFNALSTLFLTLELLDFPPYLDMWDAHALWHLCTSVLPFIFFRFVFDDLVYLRQSWPDALEKSGGKIC